MVVDGVGDGFGGGRGIIGGTGFGVDGDFSGWWVQWVSEVDPSNN